VYTTYTAVGSHEDIHSLSQRVSVQEILTSFEDKGGQPIRPIPKPRGKPATLNADKGEKPKIPAVKPKPTPLPRVASKDTEVPAAGKNSPEPGAETRSLKPPPKPKPKPKPMDLKQSSNGQKQQQPDNTISAIVPATTPATFIDITYNVSGKNPTSPSLTSPSKRAPNPVRKQKSTKYSSEATAYAVVTLATSPPQSPPPSQEVEAGNMYDEANEYDEVKEQDISTSDDFYLAPVDALTNGQELETTPSLTSKKNDITQSSSTKISSSTKERRGRFKSKQFSKSVAERNKKTDGGALDPRRKSLPDFHPDVSHIVADRRLSESLYEAVGSPNLSDVELWNSDEFDSTEDEEDEEAVEEELEQESEQPVPKLVSTLLFSLSFPGLATVSGES